MSILHAIGMALLIVGYPAFALWVVKRFKWLAWFSPVIQCYLFGVMLANFPVPIAVPAVSKALMMASVPLAIPLLLFSTDFPAWMRLARRTVVAFVLAMISAVVVSAIVATKLPVPGEESWKVAGMTVGLFTGSMPNMMAIGWALQAHENTYVLLNAVDLVLGGIFFLIVISVAKPLLSHVLPPFPATSGTADLEESDPEPQGTKTLGDVFVMHWKPLLIGLGLSVLVVLLSAGLSFGCTLLLNPATPPGRIPGHPTFNTAVMILISTLAIGASFVPRIRNLPGTFELGDYMILIFCVAIGSVAKVEQLGEAGGPFFLFLGAAMAGVVLLHWTLCAVLRIDTDTTIITTSAAIYGPPFIPPIAGAMKNKEVLVSGITSGAVGLAVGTQLGILLARLLAAG